MPEVANPLLKYPAVLWQTKQIPQRPTNRACSPLEKNVNNVNVPEAVRNVNACQEFNWMYSHPTDSETAGMVVRKEGFKYFLYDCIAVDGGSGMVVIQ